MLAGTRANIPVMVDFGTDYPQQRPLYDLLTKKLRPGDIYTHMYSGLRHEQDPVTKGPSKGFIEGRARGNQIHARVSGIISAMLAVNTNADRQSISIEAPGTDMSLVAISMSRGK